ncbi:MULTISPECIES: hypothetical protein [unclassified Hahella]|uniref:hypothetical protein n=1 Tax=unclassified Hahella TaxID=2624107 RepID=UPI001C1F0AC2|nr:MULTISPECIES: hypothetical protein [unclassified Hahella]MBU6951272.1 hypothetical protein [Hahella sp. HN01]MDG9670540.1 hypothetical protein [Hahella sp. CR1]
MMRQIMLIAAALILSGCESIAKNYLPGELILPAKNSSSHPYITDEGMIDLSQLNLKSNSKTYRNQVMSQAIALSDRKCTLHKAGIISNANAWNVGTGSAAMLFSGTASVLSHAKTAGNLAAAATATSGIQSLVNKEVYADALGTTILRSIDVARSKHKAVLEAGMKNTTADYPLSLAVLDMQAYHDSCSLMAGLVEVTKAFENRSPSRNELKRDINYLGERIASIREAQRSGVTLTKDEQDSLDEFTRVLKMKELQYVGEGGASKD